MVKKVDPLVSEAASELFNDYITEKELAAALPIPACVKTLRRWAEKGEGPPRVRQGRGWVYSKRRALEWLAKQESEPKKSKARRRARR
jgi:hypothetical protein